MYVPVIIGFCVLPAWVFQVYEKLIYILLLMNCISSHIRDEVTVLVNSEQIAVPTLGKHFV